MTSWSVRMRSQKPSHVSVGHMSIVWAYHTNSLIHSLILILILILTLSQNMSSCLSIYRMEERKDECTSLNKIPTILVTLFFPFVSSFFTDASRLPSASLSLLSLPSSFVFSPSPLSTPSAALVVLCAPLARAHTACAVLSASCAMSGCVGTPRPHPTRAGGGGGVQVREGGGRHTTPTRQGTQPTHCEGEMGRGDEEGR